MCSLNTIVIFLMSFICLSIVDASNTETRSPVLRSEGIFDTFIRNYLDVLSTAFTGKELIRYCRMMNTELKKMELKLANRLAKQFRRLSKKHRDEVVEEMARYRRLYDNKLPRQQEFFTALNEAFTLQHNLKFDDYIHDLLAFGKGDMLFVSLQEKTRSVLDMILECVDEMDNKKRKNLEKVLKLAIREFTTSH